MGRTFWLRRYGQVLAIAFVIIAIAQYAQGRALVDALLQGLVWGATSAGVFIVSRMYQSRRGRHCALCRDTPEMAAASRTLNKNR
jgi:hypothetical protein